MKRFDASKTRRGFTLIELLVVVAIIALLIAILLPSLGKARDQARISTCLANLRSVGQATLTYTAEYGGVMPPNFIQDGGAGVISGQWMTNLDVIDAYLFKDSKNGAALTQSTRTYSNKVRTCPEVFANYGKPLFFGAEVDYWFSYRYNGFLGGARWPADPTGSYLIPMRLAAVRRQSNTLMLADGEATWDLRHSYNGNSFGPNGSTVTGNQGRAALNSNPTSGINATIPHSPDAARVSHSYRETGAGSFTYGGGTTPCNSGTVNVAYVDGSARPVKHTFDNSYQPFADTWLDTRKTP